MIDVGLTLLVLPQQASERIDFDLEPGVVLVAALAFVLVNLLIAAALYPYITGESSGQPSQSTAPEESMEEMTPTDGDDLDERVDEFLEDIEQGG
jgi:hypothetical protein